MSDCQGDGKLECDGGSVATRAFWSSMSLVSNLLLLISKKAILGKNYPNQPPSLCKNNRFKARFKELRNPLLETILGILNVK